MRRSRPLNSAASAHVALSDLIRPDPVEAPVSATYSIRPAKAAARDHGRSLGPLRTGRLVPQGWGRSGPLVAGSHKA